MNENLQDEKQPYENFEELPCDILTEDEFLSEAKDEAMHLSLDVDVFVGKELNDDFQGAIEALKDCFVARTTKRSTRFYAGDICYDSKSGIISFKAGTSVPNYFTDFYKSKSKVKHGTTFADFCFLSADGSKHHTLDQCTTPFRQDYTPSDLTWLLPSKFVDDMVEMMSIMNNLILAGTMEEAILYGPELI